MPAMKLLSFAASLSLALPLCVLAQTQIAPGLTLPENGTVVVLDQGKTGPELVTLHGDEIKYNPHAAGNFGRSFAYVGPHSTVEMQGITSTHLISTRTPLIYVRLSRDGADIERSRTMLLELTPNDKTRVVAEFTANIFGGHRKRHINTIAIQKTDIADGAWLKLTLSGPLEPGEYGIAFFPKDPSLFGDVIYDFTITGPQPGATGPSSR